MNMDNQYGYKTLTALAMNTICLTALLSKPHIPTVTTTLMQLFNAQVGLHN